MQVSETKNEGLTREYSVTVEAAALNEQTEKELRALGAKVKIAGFRPGHIPLTILKQRYGKDVAGEVLERTVNQSTQSVLRDKHLRAAAAPKVSISSYEEGKDLVFSMVVETLPEVPEIDFASLSFEKLTSAVEETEVNSALTRLADRNKAFDTASADTKAKKGDQVKIDFVGKVDDVAFEGGTAKGFSLELGSNQFIDGFEEQLIGSKAGDEVAVKVTFPARYHKQDLAGKPAVFDVTVHEVRTGKATEINDELAQKFGFTVLDDLRKSVTEQFTNDYEAASRNHLKKDLFDTLEKMCNFALPPSMVEVEFKNIWNNVQQAKEEGDEELAGKSDEELKSEYEKIAERRVKLGILLSDVAMKNKIQVNQDELSRAVIAQAQQYPGQERRVFEYYQKHPEHLEELRGPILEEKAVDFILSKVTLKERAVSREELLSEPASEKSKAA